MIARYGSLAVFLLTVIAVSAISGMFGAGEWWYVDASKPGWTPPAGAFGPIWAVTYMLAALAAWQVWQTGQAARNGALIWWGIALFLVMAWNALFFGLHRIGWAWVELGLTLVAVTLCFRAFRLLSREAAYLIVPLLAWIGFLWVLNLAIWTLNGGFLLRFVA